jgi:hypothetical protein
MIVERALDADAWCSVLLESMLSRLLLFMAVILCSTSVLAQNQTYDSPDKRLQVIVVAVGKKGYRNSESRVEIRTSDGRVLRHRSFSSPDGEHGEGVGRAEWSADGQFFVFNTSSSGGHQPWHIPTYFYNRKRNRFFSLDDYIGQVTSDFKIGRRNMISTTRFNARRNEQKEPIAVILEKLRSGS